ncbi:organomercurial lyase [Rhodococcus sp. WAY2]|uniref:organomercurial lyase n=1 Tax=Rhodococcus sp. WAY2 TaxID=2663121 RepID=UPI001F2925AB|nr:organomercurial lyase [Rhodococcus sp. WAY2]
MCAVDALGMSAMLGTEAVIESADPVTGERIAVTVRGESATATPATVGGVRRCDGRAGSVRGHVLHLPEFFTDEATARSWTGEHPQVGGTVVALDHATRLGATIFSGTLTT